jgi:PAS domain S-box-containing protein
MKNQNIGTFNDSEYMVSVTDADGKITYVNKKFCDVTQYSSDELTGKTHAIVKSGHHPEIFYKNLWDTLSVGKMWTGMIKNKAKDGTYFWIKSIMTPIGDKNGKSIQYICHSTKLNISGQNDLDKLKNIENILAALDETSIVAITDVNGNITYANKKFCEISKYSEEELIGHSHKILKSGYHNQVFYKKMWKTISSGNMWQDVIKNKAKDGTFYWVKTSIFPILSKDNKIEQYVSIRTDITEQKIITEKLVKSERFVTVGEIASRFAHDVRNPLSIILAAMENLQILCNFNETQKRQIDSIERAIDRIIHQVNGVLSFVRGQPLELSMSSLSEIISDSIQTIRIPSGVKVVVPTKDISLLCDKTQCLIVFYNLILNAIQAMDGYGIVEIKTRDTKKNILIQVIDSGSGISIENLDKVFEPLFTTKQAGTGLGLPSIKSIIDAHGGTITVTSPPTMFTITLPKTEDIISDQ